MSDAPDLSPLSGGAAEIEAALTAALTTVAVLIVQVAIKSLVSRAFRRLHPNTSPAAKRGLSLS